MRYIFNLIHFFIKHFWDSSTLKELAYHQCYEYHSLRIASLDSCHHCETWAMHIIYVYTTVWSQHAGRILHMTYFVACFSVVAIWTSHNKFIVCICPDGASSYAL